jgi:tyrosyl-tRNA synthetase
MSPDLERLLAGTAQVLPSPEELERKLALGRPLRAKLGIDPSRPDLHLGHAVVLRKLRMFQDLGHTAVLIIGDFTGLVGDPSGQSETRPMLTPEEMETNARTYLEQAGLVLDLGKADIRHNSEWLAKLSMAEVLRLTSLTTVAQMLERDDFHARYREGKPISVVEFLYPLMQAMDSVAVQADVELGGTDQTFNLLMGREIQRAHDQEPQVVFTMPLIEGIDGKRKMSKSFDNYVALTDPPEEMFGKLMSIPDELIGKYTVLCAGLPVQEGGHPAERKRRMARAVVELYHGTEASRKAESHFDQVFKRHEVPEDAPEATVPEGALRDGRVSLAHLLAGLGLAGSNSEARRLIKQGGVRVGGELVEDPEAELEVAELSGKVVQVGRRRFVRIAY